MNPAILIYLIYYAFYKKVFDNQLNLKNCFFKIA